jgi:ribose transport system substrate-binding protein
LDFRVYHSTDTAQQIADIERFSVWGVDYLVILPHEAAAVTPAVKALHDKGVSCVVVDRGLENAGFGYAHISGDSAGSGKESGRWLASTMKEEGLANYLVISGKTVSGGDVRTRAFFDEMDKEISLVSVSGKNANEYIDGPAGDSVTVMKNLLNRFPKIDAVYCQDDDILRGVVQAVKESERKDVRIVLGGGASKAVLKMIMDSDPLVRATTLYHPWMVADGIQYAVDAALGEISGSFNTAKSPTTVIFPTALIDKSSAARYYNQESLY